MELKEHETLYRVLRHREKTTWNEEGMHDYGTTYTTLEKAKRDLQNDMDEVVTFTRTHSINKKALARERSMNQITSGFPDVHQLKLINILDNSAYDNLKDVILTEDDLKKRLNGDNRKSVFKKLKTVDDYVSFLKVKEIRALPYQWMYEKTISGRVHHVQSPPGDWEYNNGQYGQYVIDAGWTKFKDVTGDADMFKKAKEIIKKENTKNNTKKKK